MPPAAHRDGRIGYVGDTMVFMSEAKESSTRAPLTPGTPTPIREVPASIERPEYAWKDSVAEAIGEPWVQTPEVIEKVRVASHIAADALVEAGKTSEIFADPQQNHDWGINATISLDESDEAGHPVVTVTSVGRLD